MSIMQKIVPSPDESRRYKQVKSRRLADIGFTYVVVENCGEGQTTERKYILNGAAGSYAEDLCGALYIGTLVFVAEGVFEWGGEQLRGFAYNGTDDSGVYGYFFTDVADAGGRYRVLMSDVPWGQGEPNIVWDDPATRTS